MNHTANANYLKTSILYWVPATIHGVALSHTVNANCLQASILDKALATERIAGRNVSKVAGNKLCSSSNLSTRDSSFTNHGTQVIIYFLLKSVARHN
jgi:hypothetical protein